MKRMTGENILQMASMNKTALQSQLNKARLCVIEQKRMVRKMKRDGALDDDIEFKEEKLSDFQKNQDDMDKWIDPIKAKH